MPVAINIIRKFINVANMDEWMDRWMDGWMDGWMDDGWID
jgi:hypothetical protein